MVRRIVVVLVIGSLWALVAALAQVPDRLAVITIRCETAPGKPLFLLRGDFKQAYFEWHWPAGDQPVVSGICRFE